VGRKTLTQQGLNAGNSHVDMLKSVAAKGTIRHFWSSLQHIDGYI